MFTGIIEGLGTIQHIRKQQSGCRFGILSQFDLTGTRIGDSIAVNGVCLTAVRLEKRFFEADVSPETLEKSTFNSAAIGDRINLERALRLSDRLDGHLVTGHIDGVGHLKKRDPLGNAQKLTIGVPPDLAHYIIQKGSVAVDGISLTVNECGPNWFALAIIPHTGMLTTLGFKPLGAALNIETDVIGKYIERFVGKAHPQKATDSPGQNGVDRTLLEKSGFL